MRLENTEPVLLQAVLLTSCVAFGLGLAGKFPPGGPGTGCTARVSANQQLDYAIYVPLASRFTYLDPTVTPYSTASASPSPSAAVATTPPSCTPNPTSAASTAYPTAPPNPTPPSLVYGGCTVLAEEDLHDDGQADSRLTTAYDRCSNKVWSEHDTDADGVVNIRNEWSYDAQARLLSRSIDSDYDGSPDPVFSYRYDDLGRLVQIANDQDGDDAPDLVTTFHYDASGNVIKRELHRHIDGRQEFVRSTHYHYDELGRRIREVHGRLKVITYHWQAALILKAETDLFADGSVDATTSFEYDDSDRLTLMRTVAPDETSSRSAAYTYGSHGWLARQAEFVDEELDSTVDYSYDSRGRLISQRSWAAGLASRVTRYTNDC